ncbi:MAG: diacylglycerol kinase family protein [Patescibacteria group bacterium]
MFRIRRLFKSFTYAFHGLFKVLREEQNLKLQIIAGILVVALGAYFRISHIELALLFFAVFLVILMEIINSAIERVSDVLKPRIHSYVKEIKDIMAAAVMMSSILAVIIGLIIFYPYLFK